MLTTLEEITKEIRSELAQGRELDDLRDRAGEYVDNYVPVYNNKIVEEWQEMPSEYDDRGALEMGAESDTGIIARMSADLYVYYSDLFNEALSDVESELEEAGA